MGARGESVAVLQRLIQILKSGQIQFDEPFWPAHERFDSMEPGNQPANWFAGAAAEQFEQTFRFSSIFGGVSPVLAWLCAQPFASTEMERRRVLVAARAGQRPAVPGRLCQVKPDHLNADLWRAGKVPGTIVGAYPPASSTIAAYSRGKGPKQISMPLPSGSSTKPARTPTKVGRNDPCPCGSGKKFKKCCGKAA